jgi:hypothetical protein
MKGFIVSITIFIAMIISIFFSINYLNKTCRKLETLNVQIERNIESNSWDSAYSNSLNFLKEWEKISPKISVFTSHAEIDNVNNELYKLTQYTKCKNEDEALASANVLKFLLNHISNMEKSNTQNIF